MSQMWKSEYRRFFPDSKDYWAIKWFNAQSYKDAVYDHRIVKVSKPIAIQVVKGIKEKIACLL